MIHEVKQVHYGGAKKEPAVIHVWGMGPATSYPPEKERPAVSRATATSTRARISNRSRVNVGVHWHPHPHPRSGAGP